MSLWQPVAILPNFELEGQTAIDVPHATFASVEDPRVQEINAAAPKHAELLGRWRDPFGEECRPTLLLLSPNAPTGFNRMEAVTSLRDILSISVVPLARSRHRPGQYVGPLPYSNVFEFYPWAVAKELDGVVTSTPGVRGSHDLEKLNPQTAPETGRQSRIGEHDLDRPMFNALLEHWRSVSRVRRKHAHAADKVLRSLNMAYHASKLPALQDARVFDDGRLVALWVSAFEILAHPAVRDVNQWDVYDLLDSAEWRRAKNRRREFLIAGRKRPKRTRPCKVYRRLYEMRNDFLHGNPVSRISGLFGDTGIILHKAAAPLYRIALSAALRVRLDHQEPENLMEALKHRICVV
ncbi:MAG: hypothetical protein OXG44_18385, partial [Gammaproteobacteria bacterium]|nr:hypothetical protein [Gammaproteobacteria bacterium]